MWTAAAYYDVLRTTEPTTMFIQLVRMGWETGLKTATRACFLAPTGCFRSLQKSLIYISTSRIRLILGIFVHILCGWFADRKTRNASGRSILPEFKHQLCKSTAVSNQSIGHLYYLALFTHSTKLLMRSGQPRKPCPTCSIDCLSDFSCYNPIGLFRGVKLIDPEMQNMRR